MRYTSHICGKNFQLSDVNYNDENMDGYKDDLLHAVALWNILATRRNALNAGFISI